MAAAIADVTGAEPETVRKGLWREFLIRGSSVARAGRRLGVRPYLFDDAMIALYSTTDAFLYELAVWNINLLKRSMRSWIVRWITSVLGKEQRVLSWGDGLGFDSLALARAGHQVTCFDLPGSTSTFAQRMLAGAGADVKQIDNPDELPDAAFDAVVCLDVLEHVPDVEAELARIARCLRPGGLLVVHAPFYFIHRVSITHLRKNRRYSGSLALFRKAGFSLVDAQPTWAPMMWRAAGGPRVRRPLLAWLRLAIALPFGLVLAIGRFTALPFEVINLVCRLGQLWYTDDMLGRGRRTSA
ncbi:MAG: class I SAM-dependent methyltransferase [Planctomycetota bacterium]|nr:class I SAM-dependent methyltransferase [Planctomycetota bacterium]